MAGRNGKYESHIKPNFKMILGYLRSGYTEKSIAKRLGVSVDSWGVYKKTYPAFSALIKKGGQDSRALVVNALYKRARGIFYEEIHTEIKEISGESNPKSNSKDEQKTDLSKKSTAKVVRKVRKYIPPDVGAIAIILFNRLNNKWRNKQFIHEEDEDAEKRVRFSFAPPTNSDKKSKKNKNDIDDIQNANNIAGKKIL